MGARESKLGPPPNKGELCVRLTKEALRRLRQPAADPGPLPADSADTLLYSTDTLLTTRGRCWSSRRIRWRCFRAGAPSCSVTFSNDCSSGSGCPRSCVKRCRRTRARRASWLPSRRLGHPLERVPCTEENLRPPPTGDAHGQGRALRPSLARGPSTDFGVARGAVDRRGPVMCAGCAPPPPIRRRRRRRAGPLVERGAGRRAARRRGGGRRRRRGALGADMRGGRGWRRSRCRRPRRRLQCRRRRRRGRRQQLRRVHGLAAIAHLRSVRAPVRVRDVLRRGDERQQGVPDLPRARPNAAMRIHAA